MRWWSCKITATALLLVLFVCFCVHRYRPWELPQRQAPQQAERPQPLPFNSRSSYQDDYVPCVHGLLSCIIMRAHTHTKHTIDRSWWIHSTVSAQCLCAEKAASGQLAQNNTAHEKRNGAHRSSLVTCTAASTNNNTATTNNNNNNNNSSSSSSKPQRQHQQQLQQQQQQQQQQQTTMTTNNNNNNNHQRTTTTTNNNNNNNKQQQHQQQSSQQQQQQQQQQRRRYAMEARQPVPPPARPGPKVPFTSRTTVQDDFQAYAIPRKKYVILMPAKQ